jgi:hypothetical protein
MTRPGDELALAGEDGSQAELEERSAFFHDAVSDWLADPDITIVCGRWSEGAISEFLPGGSAGLLPPAYDGRFAGIRELRIRQQRHHLHIDFGRVHTLSYVVAPSVCLGFDPSLEIRLLTTDEAGNRTEDWMVALMYTNPYLENRRVDRRAAGRFFRKAREHLARRPDLVRLRIEPEVTRNVHAGALFDCLAEASGRAFDAMDWDEALAALGARAPRDAAPAIDEPRIVPLLRDALALREASLVIFRDRTLVEFKTDRLGGLHRYVEHGHVSWQIGRFEDHHCHLALGEVTEVLFSAEPVPCQGNRLNYTLWFLVPGACGNPYRPDGYFSITLNKPYRAGVPRLEVIEPVMSLYRRYRGEAWVSADERFLEALAEGPAGRRFD